MENIINYEFNDFYSIVINHVSFKNRFTLFKVIKEQTNKICMIVFCSNLHKLCFLKVKSINKKNNFETSVYDLLKKNYHPNIEVIYEVYESDDLLFILSEYIEGKNLTQYEKIYDNNLIKKIINQTYEGLNYIHKMNIIHGDIKLENIMLTKNEDIKLIDFDLSKVCNNYITSKVTFGSENYIAPESFDLQIYSKRSDIWSFGISLYKLVSGKFPYIFKPNKSCHMYMRNNFKLLNFQELDNLSHIYDNEIISSIKKMLNFVDENRPLNIKI